MTSSIASCLMRVAGPGAGMAARFDFVIDMRLSRRRRSRRRPAIDHTCSNRRKQFSRLLGPVSTATPGRWHGDWPRPGLSMRSSAITRGGLVPAAIVARGARHPGGSRRSCIASYNHTTQGELTIGSRVWPSTSSRSAAGGAKACWWWDDLVDTGQTRQARARHSARSAFRRRLRQSRQGPPDWSTPFITEVSQDTWIFFPWDTGLGVSSPPSGRVGCSLRRLLLWCQRKQCRRTRHGRRHPQACHFSMPLRMPLSMQLTHATHVRPATMEWQKNALPRVAEIKTPTL